MRYHIISVALTVTLCGSAAQACIIAHTNLSDAKYADVVVVGRIRNLHLVLDQTAREQARKQFFTSGRWLNPKAYFGRPEYYAGDYARFDIAVDEVLKGRAGKTLSATWDTAHDDMEKMASVPYLIAFRRAGGGTSNGPTAAFPVHEPGTLTVLQSVCGGPLIFDSNSQAASNIRLILRGKPLPKPLPAPAPAYITAKWAVAPSARDMAQFFPPRAREDEIEGSATVECTAARSGAVACKAVTENPPGYGFGDATVKLFQAGAKLAAGTYHKGDRMRFTYGWRLD